MNKRRATNHKKLWLLAFAQQAGRQLAELFEQHWRKIFTLLSDKAYYMRLTDTDAACLD
jgi:hypothetical protein